MFERDAGEMRERERAVVVSLLGSLDMCEALEETIPISKIKRKSVI